MPKTEIDYSTTIIYKITCKDENIKDLYVGHTTNFVQRKHAHKQNAINTKSSNNKCKLYEVIRANGGWTNWTMEIINFFNCKDHYEARKKEQEYFILLNANLNSIEPLPKPKEVQPVIKKNEEDLFTCEKCDYSCKKQSDFKKHLTTLKHSNDDIKLHNCDLTCSCGKKYTFRQGLSIHKKTCTYDKSNNELENKNIINLLLKQNEEMKNMLIKLVKNNSELQIQLEKYV
jgi:hypothetical protein